MRMLERDGYEIHRSAVENLLPLIEEAERLAAAAGSACVREADRSCLFRTLAHSQELRALVGCGLEPVRLILFDKTTSENWPVGWHQDLAIAVASRVEVEGYEAWTVKNGVPHVRPPLNLLERMVAARLHLDDAPRSNGALRVAPGSHVQGFVASEQVVAEVQRRGEIVCECQAGDVVLMKPLLLHASSRSEDARHRRVLHIEYARRELLDGDLSWHLEQCPEDVDVS